MNRTATLLTVVVLIVGSLSAIPAAAALQTDSSVTPAIGESTYAQVDENASENATLAPGERLSGVVGLTQAEFEGEVEQRAYGIEFASAASDEAKADVVAERLTAIEQRLNELEAQKAELQEARENGEISEGEYRALVTELAARTKTVEQMADASEARANSLPEQLLMEKGIDVEKIQMLKMGAEELSGDEVAEIAKQIGGDNVGQPISQGPPSQIGMPSQAGDGGPDAAEDGQDRGDGTPTDVEDGDDGAQDGDEERPTDTGDGDGQGQADGSGQGR